MAKEETWKAAIWPPRVASCLAGLVMVAFGLQSLLDIPIEPVDLLAAGALTGWPDTFTQPDRLFTYALLHVGLAHAYLNASVLFLIGVPLETSLGARRLVVVFVTGVLAGGVATAWFHPSLATVGASSAAWAAIGGLLAALWARPEQLPEQVRRARSPISLVVVLSLVPMPWLLPNISFAGHLGGFVAGLVVVGWMLSTRRCANRGDVGLSVAFVAAVLIALLSTAVGLHRAVACGREAGLDAVVRLLTHSGSAPSIQDAAARVLARDPTPGRTRLVVARDTLLARTTLEPSLDRIEALAKIHYRLGDLERAVELGRERLSKDDSNEAAADLARYLAATAAGVEPPKIGTVRFLQWRKHESEVEVRWVEPLRSGAEFFAAVARDQQIVGLLRFETGPSAASSERFAIPETVLVSGLEGANAELWLLREGSPSALSPGAFRWRIWPLRSEPTGDREPRY